jgi:hypothetical protein
MGFLLVDRRDVSRFTRHGFSKTDTVNNQICFTQQIGMNVRNKIIEIFFFVFCSFPTTLREILLLVDVVPDILLLILYILFFVHDVLYFILVRISLSDSTQDHTCTTRTVVRSGHRTTETSFVSEVSMTERVMKKKKVFKTLDKDGLFLEWFGKQPKVIRLEVQTLVCITLLFSYFKYSYFPVYLLIVIFLCVRNIYYIICYIIYV